MKTASMIVLGGVLLACASAPPQHGLLVPQEQAPAAALRALGADAAATLVEGYAEQHFWLGHLPADDFGRALVDELRRAGLPVSGPAVKRPAQARALRYVVDQLKDTPLLRAIVYVDRRSLTRVYRATPAGAAPAGPWTYREQP